MTNINEKNNKKAIAVIQVRMSSTRLPGKTLMPLAAKPMLWHICNRLNHCQELDKVIVATSKERNDDKIEEFCKKNKIEFHRGSLDNVLERFVDVIDKYNPDYIARICGDAPFITPEFIDAQIKAIKLYKGDTVLSRNKNCFFEGQDAYSSKALKKAYKFSKDKMNLEHVGYKYFLNNLDKLRVVLVNVPEEEEIFKGRRFCVDTLKDYKFVSKIYQDLYKENKIINFQAIKDWILKNKELLEINKNISMKPYYKKIEKAKQDNFEKANIVGQNNFKIYEKRF